MAADHSGRTRICEDKSDTSDRKNRRRDNRGSAGLDFADHILAPSERKPSKRPSMKQDNLAKLEQRLGRVYTSQRLGIEKDHERRVFGGGINFFHFENWYSIHSVIRNSLKLVGLYQHGCDNAERIQVRHNHVQPTELPTAFDGFTILHISDMHADMSRGAMGRLAELLDELTYDLCVLTGDYRGKTFGPFDGALEEVKQVRL